MPYAHLSQRGVLAVSGEDATAFLQGLITNDAAKVKNGNAVYAALLSPQGKFLHDFFLYPVGEKILIDCEKPRMDDLRKRLSLYKLRSKVTIEIMPENVGVVAVWNEENNAGTPDPRLPALGFRIVGDIAQIQTSLAQHAQATADDYDRMRLALGVPDGSRDMEIDRAIILHYGFEDLHGVDFSKGCYVGQEVIARTKYRGQIRKFLYRVRSETKLPESGTPIYLGDVQAGDLHSVIGNEGLAILKVEAVMQAQKTGALFRAGDVSLSAELPEWVTTKLSAAAE